MVWILLLRNEAYFCILWNIIISIFVIIVTLHPKVNAAKDEKIYTFAYSNDGFPNDFQQDGEVTGQSVDLTLAVCKFANKKCKVSFVQRQHCWDTTMGFPSYSLALNNRWFDSCANYPPNVERRMSYAFGSENYFNTPVPILVASAKSSVTLEELKTCNDRKVVYASNLGLTPNCLLDTGYFIKKENRIPIRVPGENDLFTIMAELEKMTLNKTRIPIGVSREYNLHKADLALIVPRFASGVGTKVLTDLPCGNALQTGLNNMFRNDATDIQKWWSEAVHKFMCGSKYKSLCATLKDNYDEDPLCRTPGKDLDCGRFGGPKIPKDTSVSKRIFPCVKPVYKDHPREEQNVVFRSRWSLCRDEQCTGLKPGKTAFLFKDNNGADMSDSLSGSGNAYEGPPKENVQLTITGPPHQRFWVENICFTLKNAKEVKFVFRGGLRKAKEVNIPIEDELEWTTHCLQHTEERNMIRIKLRVRNVKDKQIRIMVKAVEMKACQSAI